MAVLVRKCIRHRTRLTDFARAPVVRAARRPLAEVVARSRRVRQDHAVFHRVHTRARGCISRTCKRACRCAAALVQIIRDVVAELLVVERDVDVVRAHRARCGRAAVHAQALVRAGDRRCVRVAKVLIAVRYGARVRILCVVVLRFRRRAHRAHNIPVAAVRLDFHVRHRDTVAVDIPLRVQRRRGFFIPLIRTRAVRVVVLFTRAELRYIVSLERIARQRRRRNRRHRRVERACHALRALGRRRCARRVCRARIQLAVQRYRHRLRLPLRVDRHSASRIICSIVRRSNVDLTAAGRVVRAGTCLIGIPLIEFVAGRGRKAVGRRRDLRRADRADRGRCRAVRAVVAGVVVLRAFGRVHQARAAVGVIGQVDFAAVDRIEIQRIAGAACEICCRCITELLITGGLVVAPADPCPAAGRHRRDRRRRHAHRRCLDRIGRRCGGVEVLRFVAFSGTKRAVCIDALIECDAATIDRIEFYDSTIGDMISVILGVHSSRSRRIIMFACRCRVASPAQSSPIGDSRGSGESQDKSAVRIIDVVRRLVRLAAPVLRRG